MNGTENISVEEKQAMEELRLRLESLLKTEMTDDPYLLYRFLKARDFDVDKAEVMLRKHIEWRAANGIDKILMKYQRPEVIEKYLLPNFIGLSKDDDIIRYSSCGNTDWKGFFKSATVNECFKAAVHLCEVDSKFLNEQSKKLGKLVQSTLIFDLANATLAKLTNKKMIELMIKLVNLNQDNYPERLKSCYVINAPGFFSLVFSILKAIMASAVLQKFHVFGTDGWKEVLLEKIDTDVLPAFLGGNRTDPDGNPLCKTFVNHGGLVPEEYYVTKSNESFSNMNDAKKLLIPNQSRETVSQNVLQSGSFLEWEFEVKYGDIGFGLLCRHDCNETLTVEELIPLYRIQTIDGPETGVHKCETSGTYILVFDNSHSWFRSKEVYYRCKTVNPDPNENEK